MSDKNTSPLTAGTDMREPYRGGNAQEAATVLTWTTPSRSSFGSMPLGNGVVGVNVWLEGDGDLFFYISKVDACGAKPIMRVSRDGKWVTLGLDSR